MIKKVIVQKIVASNLSRILKERGLTMMDIVRISGVSGPTLQKLRDLPDGYQPRNKAVRALEKALGLSRYKIFTIETIKNT
jgi:predicted transcriptional regulator